MDNGTIKAPENPSLLAMADALRNLDSRTARSPANLLVPMGAEKVLRRWGYGESTTPIDKLGAVLDIPNPVSPEITAALKAIGPLYRGAQNLKRLEGGHFFHIDPDYANQYARYGEEPTLTKVEIPDEGHVDLSTDPELRAKFQGETFDDLPSYESVNELRRFLDEHRPDWVSTKVHEGGSTLEHQVPYSYMLRDPDRARLAFGLRDKAFEARRAKDPTDYSYAEWEEY